ncbi:hypothetical protein ACJ72_02153 [Emergomyces africanus]|uniref:Mitochondrial GTPase 1 n=1 Tax=Emergomyces africanus TaxID=1955775 RepID=A0A1B7P390_9EURO|nr:hypothetical protein ACJ72_02153 [Emergomyces africanus]
MASTFVPRAAFPAIDSIPRTYFLGHHKAGLENMKKMLSSIDQIIECRDFRIPATSINPMFEEALGEKPRWIHEQMIQRWHKTSKTFFTNRFNTNSIVPILKALRSQPINTNKLTGSRILVVGMPNIGKSSLINALRHYVMKRGKVAKTGADPGVTRKIGTGIKILDRPQGSVYVHDTPGVFMPYMPDSESMLKLALCGCVKHTIIPSITLADYLLYQINLHKPRLYEKFSQPTNEIIPFLESFGAKSGCFAKGGTTDLDAAARKMVHMYREGKLGTFIMDNILETTLKLKEERLAAMGGSINQAKKAEKQAKREEHMETVEVV